MICDKYKCIFIHIPKSAGQSIEHLFVKLVGLTWEERSPLLLRENKDPNKGPTWLAHLYANEYLKYGYINQDTYDEYYKFSFVRNPWERLVSEYKYRNHHENFSFKDFVFYNLPEKGMSDEYRHIVPQYNFLYSETGKPMVNFIGKFENLQQDFNVIASDLGLPKSKLPHINKSYRSQFKSYLGKLVALAKINGKPAARNYRDYYDDNLRKTVTKMYEIDIDTFGYSF